MIRWQKWVLIKHRMPWCLTQFDFKLGYCTTTASEQLKLLCGNSLLRLYACGMPKHKASCTASPSSWSTHLLIATNLGATTELTFQRTIVLRWLALGYFWCQTKRISEPWEVQMSSSRSGARWFPHTFFQESPCCGPALTTWSLTSQYVSFFAFSHCIIYSVCASVSIIISSGSKASCWAMPRHIWTISTAHLPWSMWAEPWHRQSHLKASWTALTSHNM